MRQLPVEGQRYHTMDRMWRKIMNGAKADPKANSYEHVHLDMHVLCTYKHVIIRCACMM